MNDDVYGQDGLDGMDGQNFQNGEDGTDGGDIGVMITGFPVGTGSSFTYISNIRGGGGGDGGWGDWTVFAGDDGDYGAGTDGGTGGGGGNASFEMSDLTYVAQDSGTINISTYVYGGNGGRSGSVYDAAGYGRYFENGVLHLANEFHQGYAGQYGGDGGDSFNFFHDLTFDYTATPSLIGHISISAFAESGYGGNSGSAVTPSGNAGDLQPGHAGAGGDGGYAFSAIRDITIIEGDQENPYVYGAQISLSAVAAAGAPGLSWDEDRDGQGHTAYAEVSGNLVTLGNTDDTVSIAAVTEPVGGYVAPGWALIENNIIDMGDGDDEIKVYLQSTSNTNSLANNSFDGGDGSDVLRLWGIYDNSVHEVGSGNFTFTANGDGSYDMACVSSGIYGTNHLIGVEQVAFTDRIVNLGTNGDDLQYAGGISLTFIGGAGSDTASFIYSTPVTADLSTNSGINGNGDSLVFDSIENLTGSEGDDSLTGNSGVNVLSGNGGDDRLDGGIGKDTMAGGLDDDTYIVDNIQDLLIETSGGGLDTVEASLNWTLGAYLENLTLTGPAAINGTGNGLDNELTGNGAVNVLRGLGGGDRLDGGAGADRMYGGAGNDTYIVDVAGELISEQTVTGVDDGGVDTVLSSVGFTLGIYIENLILTGSGAINGVGNTLGNAVTGNDAINVLKGMDGADSLDGKGGADKMYGGAGNDSYYVDTAGEVVSEQTVAGVDDGGVDTVFSAVTFTLGGFVENLTLTGSVAINGVGNALDDTIFGNDAVNILKGLGGADRLDGGAGADRMYGGSGDDTYVVDTQSELVSEQTVAGVDDGGNDTVLSSASFILGNFLENLALTGSAAISATGNASANTLDGNDAVNILKGMNGDDILTGHGGNDTLTGGLGADSFVFSHFGASNGVDRVTDFTAGTDHLVFKAADFGWSSGHVLSANELAVGSASGAGGQFVFNPVNGVLAWDANGAAAGGISNIAALTAVTALAAADFTFL